MAKKAAKKASTKTKPKAKKKAKAAAQVLEIGAQVVAHLNFNGSPRVIAGTVAEILDADTITIRTNTEGLPHLFRDIRPAREHTYPGTREGARPAKVGWEFAGGDAEEIAEAEPDELPGAEVVETETEPDGPDDEDPEGDTGSVIE